jgi:hypothetical protein
MRGEEAEVSIYLVPGAKVFGLGRSLLRSAERAFLGGEYLSRYTLVNFPSLYAPLTAHPCIYDVTLYAADGSRIGKRELRVAPYGSLEVRPEEVFGMDLPDLGMFATRIRSAEALNFAYKYFGTVTSHFFALVHPQTLIDAASGEKMAWTSSLYLFRAGAESDRIWTLAGVIPPMGARKVSWDLPDIGLTHGLFSIGANGLPTTNAKPVLLTHFEDGLISGMHA